MSQKDAAEMAHSKNADQTILNQGGQYSPEVDYFVSCLPDGIDKVLLKHRSGSHSIGLFCMLGQNCPKLKKNNIKENNAK